MLDLGGSVDGLACFLGNGSEGAASCPTAAGRGESRGGRRSRAGNALHEAVPGEKTMFVHFLSMLHGSITLDRLHAIFRSGKSGDVALGGVVDEITSRIITRAVRRRHRGSRRWR